MRETGGTAHWVPVADSITSVGFWTNTSNSVRQFKCLCCVLYRFSSCFNMALFVSLFYVRMYEMPVLREGPRDDTLKWRNKWRALEAEGWLTLRTASVANVTWRNANNRECKRSRTIDSLRTAKWQLLVTTVSISTSYIITHAGIAASVGMAFQHVCLSVCVSVCPHSNKTKTHQEMR